MTGIDEIDLLARATAAADKHWPGAAVSGLRRLPGGVSSLTYASTLTVPHAPPARIVLKVAPPGLAPVRNRDVLRQAKVINLLDHQPGMRVPSVLLEDDGAPPLFAMELKDGDSYEPHLDLMDEPPTPAVVDVRARTAARMLGRMQNLSPTTIGVADEPVMSLQQELDRWARLFGTVDDDIAPGHRDLYERLARRIPAGIEPTLLHGDYRLANMLFAGKELTAVIDWEIWSVGDPRTDLVWLLMHTDPVHRFRLFRDDRNADAGRGMPSLGELLEEYLTVRAVPVVDLEWFLAYAHYKTASTISVFVKRNRRLADPDQAIVIAGESLPTVIGRGAEIMTHAEQGTSWRH